MLLYKYRSLYQIEYLLDILINERLYCADYLHLNDPFEGQFLLRRHYAGGGIGGNNYAGGVVTSNRSIEDILGESAKKKICSLSSSCRDVRLWSLYADSHRGVAIEIDFGGVEKSLTKVDYQENLLVLTDSTLARSKPEEILSTKTKHWEYESEYRVVSDQDYFLVSGRIRRVISGIRADQHRIALLEKILLEKIPIIQAKLDYSGAEVIA